MLYMATGKPAHLVCKFLSDVSVVNSPIVVELLVITVLFCVVLPAGSTTQNKTSQYLSNKFWYLLTKNKYHIFPTYNPSSLHHLKSHGSPQPTQL